MDTFVSFEAALSELTIETADARKARSWLSGTSTGIRELDNILGGLHPSELIVIGGRPSNGKTSLATNIAYNVARSLAADTDATHPSASGSVAFFSLEMTAAQIARRMLSEQSAISSADIRRGMVTDDDAQTLAAISKLASLIPLYFDHSASLSIEDLSDRARQLKNAKGLNLIVVDYLQLVSSTTGNRVQSMTEVTAGLKSLAKELAVPVIALSQVSRQIEQRDDKRPQLSDLRESGSIEQDADVVMFVFREEHYVERAKPYEGTHGFREWQLEMERVIGRAEVIVAKQRHGHVGSVELAFDSRCTRFSSLSHRL